MIAVRPDKTGVGMGAVKLLCLALLGISVLGAVEGVHILRTGIGSPLPHPVLRTVFSIALAFFLGRCILRRAKAQGHGLENRVGRDIGRLHPVRD